MTTAFPTKLTKTALFTICAICWVLQSLPAFYLYMDGREVVQQKTTAATQLMLPQLLFCNRFPFTQAGLASLGQQFGRDSVLAYLRQWLDPSLGAHPPEDALGAPLTETDRQQAEQTIAQLLPNGRLKQRLEQLMPQCQDMVSSCVLGSRQLGGFDCCRMVQPWLATPQGGICWPFVGNLSSLQGPFDSQRGMQITFQISRNSFLSSSLSVHPGIDVFLLPPDLHNRLRMAVALEQSFPLNDKRALRMDIRKETKIKDELTNFCHSTAESIQKGQLSPGATAGLLCMLERAIEKCACVPMLVVLWTLQNDLESSFLRRFNASTICTVGEFEHCVRPYIQFALEPAWEQYTVPDTAPVEFKEGLDACRKLTSFSPCQQTHFLSRTQERDLPAEYRNTQDFVSRVSLTYDSFLVTETRVVKQMDLYQLLSTLGLNLWWFAIGHLIWSACRFRCIGAPSSKGSRVEPKSPMIPPGSASGSQQQQNQNRPPSNTNQTQQQQPQVFNLSPNQSPRVQAAQQIPPRAIGARQLPPLAIPPRQNGSAGNGGMLGSVVSAAMEVEQDNHGHGIHNRLHEEEEER